MKMKGFSKKTLAVLCIVALLSGVGVALAVGLTIISNPVTVTVTEVTLTLASSDTSLLLGESCSLTATASDGAASAGISVTFKEGDTVVDTEVFDSVGVASISITPSIGPHTYIASYSHP